MDNLSNFGIKDDPPRTKRGKTRGKRKKPFVIECRIQRKVSNPLAHSLRLHHWWVHSRYPTASRRDQAYAALVKKDASSPSWWKLEYRKKDYGDLVG